MKLLVISDIHSNIHCLNAVLEREKDADRIYCAGDFVDVGLYPKETVHRLRELKVPAVRGNHDDKIIRIFRSGPPDEDQEWTFPIMNAQHLDEEDIEYLDTLPEQIRFTADGVSYVMQHLYQGYQSIETETEFLEFWDDPTETVDRSQKKVAIFGHTHRPAIRIIREDCLVVNPGSVGYNRPSDPSIATRYLTITDGEIELKDLHHDHCMSRPELGREFLRRHGHLRGPAPLSGSLQGSPGE
ncbi:MAG: metallophosphoesterase family protein [Verrucomicrobia bacterium]|nr:metallophosphoesterase family protein [Verrucomicrobiota bacterium]MCH8513352.1 metallophosphatase family protein [Kiritimatiellia bacterium]